MLFPCPVCARQTPIDAECCDHCNALITNFDRQKYRDGETLGKVNVTRSGATAQKDKSFWWKLGTIVAFIAFLSVCAVCYVLSKSVDGLRAQLATIETSPPKIEIRERIAEVPKRDEPPDPDEVEIASYFTKAGPVLTSFTKLRADLDFNKHPGPTLYYSQAVRDAHKTYLIWKAGLSLDQTEYEMTRYLEAADMYYLSAYQKWLDKSGVAAAWNAKVERNGVGKKLTEQEVQTLTEVNVKEADAYVDRAARALESASYRMTIPKGLRCSICAGTGVFKCQMCNGTDSYENAKCPRCENGIEMNCPTCDGKGKIENRFNLRR